ncbi:MAG: ParB/RepB/Spo0J family partition protein [Clostridiales bacterium]|jgi:ParB family chromosome partitioning protein|nr:ParB/RepB/Spo0J family partition protein [Clostridiales bacterium]
MAVKRSALGKGLGALIPEVDEKKLDINKNGILEVDINYIAPNEKQPRKNFDEEKLNILSQSIKEKGVIQPILVTKDGEYYTIIAGERRWRAAKLAGLKKIPVIEKKLSAIEVMEISLIENLQREDLNPMEEAMAYKRLVDEFSLTQEEISRRVGKSRPAIANSLRLLNLDSRVRNYIVDGTLSEGHGRVLVSLDNMELQYEVAKKIIDESLNVRQTEKLIKRLNENRPVSKKSEQKEIYIKEIEEKFKNALGTKVCINKTRKKGKIEIEYYSEDDLQRILDILNL